MPMVSHLILESILEIKIEIIRLTGAPLRNRTVDLLLTMHAGYVRWRRVASDYRRSARYRCLGTSCSVCHCLEP